MRTGIAKWTVGLATAVALTSIAPAFAAPTQPLPPSERTERTLSRAEFRDRMMAKLKARSPDLKVTIVSEEELVVVRGEEGDFRLFLTNAYRQYLNEPGELEAVLDKYARLTLEPDDKVAITTASLRLLVRPDTFLGSARSAARKEGKAITPDIMPMNRPLVGDLMVLVAQDLPETFRYPPRGDMIEAIPDEKTIWDGALASTRSGVGEILVEEIEPGLFAVSTTSSLAPSLMLLDEPWARRDLKGKGDPVVLVVDKETLALAHADNADAMAMIRRLRTSMARDPESGLLSSQLYVRREGVWRVLED